ncbi:MAG TPA: PAS domain-containing sensor histidine kinase [Rhizomicrobium sp.]|nr:PAS domain-containing sensor histidine kinase [Rhizomicrobium sp.]
MPVLEPSRTRERTGLAVMPAVFIGGLLLGVGLAANLGVQFTAGLVMMAVLGIVLAVLARVARDTRRRVTAGEASYRAFFDHAVEGIFRTTPDGHYLAVNQALADIYGYENPAVLMGALTDIGSQLYVEPRRRDEFSAQMQAHDVVTNFVSEIHHRSGRRLWISENARAVRDWSGTLLCYEGTVEDVTEKFEAERALRVALRQAEIANKVKAAFLAAMSHELKTPLNAVLGFSEIIRDEMLGPVGQPVYRDYANDIHKSGARLLAVINDVLDVTRLESGSLAIEDQPESPQEIIGQAIKLARKATGDERAVSLHLPAEMPTLLVDPRRLAQALGNVLANALKFTPTRGDVGLRLTLEPDNGVVFAIEDTGIGMAEETIAAALEPFRQLDGSLARKFEGAGLGLSIAKSLVELHGGCLRIASKVGSGTQVTMSLPPSRVTWYGARSALA